MKVETYIAVLKESVDTIEKRYKEHTQGDEVASELLRCEIKQIIRDALSML